MNSDLLLQGRAFATKYQVPEVPVWAPLEAVARMARADPWLPSFHEIEFMYMAGVRNARKKLTIHLYKHVDTRRYLNLDEDGNAYAFHEPDRYRRYRTIGDAIAHLQLWLFDVEGRYRSYSPEDWDRVRLLRPRGAAHASGPRRPGAA